MPRVCTVCAHPEREAIDAALVANEPYRHIASRFGTSTAALQRHKAEHLPGALTQAKQAEDVAEATRVMAELERCFSRVNLLFDACDRWLRDADDPTRYDIGPRAEDVTVTYQEKGQTGVPVQRKAKLSALLRRLESGGVVKSAEFVEIKRADPRELILKTARQLQGQIELLAELMGELDKRAQINIHLSPEWVAIRTLLLNALQPYAEARAAVAVALGQAEGGRQESASNGHRP